MITINIDNESCTRCSKCVKVCPAHILIQENPKADVGTIRVDTCITCGHCVAICPTNSVIHSEFSENKVHSLNREILPKPEQVLELFRARRSNRAFLKSAIPEEFLNQIVEAAHLAPTASNMQGVSFTLVTNPELLKLISGTTIGVFEAAAKKMQNPLIKPFLNLISPGAKEFLPHIQGIIAKFKRGDDLILRGAKAVLLVHTPSNSNFGRQDANLAYQNASLMAESLGVTQFYTGYVCISTDLDKKKNTLAKLLNIDGKIHAGMALAMPAFKFTKYTDRKDLQLNILS